jgi:hypothetical protein
MTLKLLEFVVPMTPVPSSVATTMLDHQSLPSERFDAKVVLEVPINENLELVSISEEVRTTV